MSTQTPRVIAFDDIREGDRIEIAWRGGGLEEAYRGVAAYTTAHGAWCTEEGMLLAERGAEGEGGTITLLHRPTVTEPKGLGAVVRARVPVIGGMEPRACTRFREGRLAWVAASGLLYSWDEVDPDSIEVLSEGIEVDQ